MPSQSPKPTYLLDTQVAAIVFWGEQEDIDPFESHVERRRQYITHYAHTQILVRALDVGRDASELDELSEVLEFAFEIAPLTRAYCHKFAEIMWRGLNAGLPIARDIAWMVAFAEQEDLKILTRRPTAFEGLCSEERIVDP